MSTSPSWHHLPLASTSGLPVLLVTMDVGISSYAVQVTDMANIWTESLDRKAICMRAWGENTSIDPSDTPDNMAKFLSSLKSALDSSQPGHDQTSLTLSSAKFDNAGENGLTLKLVCNLPGLQPLRWPIHLKKGPPTAIATDLVLPLIQAHYARKQEVDSLVQVLGHKDAVIAKLVDKLEAMGTGLEHVFTALSGRKKVSRSVAEDKIRGLAPFNLRKWKAKLENDHDGPADTAELTQSVFEGNSMPSRTYIEFENSPGLEGWWHDIKAHSEIPIREQAKKGNSIKGSPKQRTLSDEPMDDDGDDFQVQATPPGLKTHHGKEDDTAAPDDASTQDEDDSESEPPVTSHKKPKQKDAKKPTSRFGAIGGKKQVTTHRSPSPEIIPEKPTKDDSETASEAENDEDATASLAEESPSPPPPKAAPKTGGLGRIGGRKARATRERTKTPEPTTKEVKQSESQQLNTPKKLGHIGKATDTSPTATHDAKRGRRAAQQQESEAKEQHRETSQERADRRRDELKRELERKAAAGPAKKKRRF
ncbi:hypothetical protein HJFPF1_01697 [Paramyrothecium foliicola]|nr:hypothetical protein HJFPF1_01697 [Paramyrothecium foliicola]